MFRIKYGVALIALAYAGMALADDLPEFNGGELVVTASGVPQPLGVTVITAQDIANSTASNVTDVLASVGGVHVFSTGGTTPVVDLGGFGMTGMSNTLILVDGVKQNASDQSPPDINYVPLASIERIEIVRGAGAVPYGDGASGGVINIITRTGQQANSHLTLTQTLGSFNMRQSDLSFSLAGERVSLDGFASSMNTDHYQQNDAERNDGGGLGVNWKFGSGSARAYVRSSSDSQQYPGPLYVNSPTLGVNQFNSNFSGASTPYDSGSVKTNVAGIQVNNQMGAGRVYFDAATRNKTTIGNFVSEAAYGGYSHRTLDEDSGSLRYALPFAGNDQWMLGVDWLNGGASNNANGSFNGGKLPSVQTIASNTERHQGVFSELQSDLWSGARATIGARAQRVDDDLTCNPANSASTACTNDNIGRVLHAWQLGLRQALGEHWSAYASLGQSFRLANSDELEDASAPLNPQQAHDQQIGLEWSQDQARLRAGLFRSDVSNEIHYLPQAYNPVSQGNYGANVNLSPTRHQGFNLEGQLPLSSTVTLNGNLSWQQATFRSGSDGGVDLSNNHIPMVPSLMGNLGVSWQASAQTRASMQVNYVGAQRMDGDEDNAFATQLAAYTVLNAKLMHQFSKSVSGTLSVSNLLDRHYAVYGSDWNYNSAYSLTPADPRNIQASLSWTF
jgi:iron complex outermembrane receptor protein